MEHIQRMALGGREDFERFDAAEALNTFQRLNEQWEEEYAEIAPEDWDKRIPRGFLEGRRAFIFRMFYRVVELHEREVEQIRADGKEDA